jgi:predicted nucleotidyltransferase component of viral defense system
LTARKTDPLAQSVHDRLLRVAKAGKDDFNIILARYSVERLLYRLSRTRHANRFVLKGAMLFVLWLNRLHRPTRDLDLLGVGQVDEQMLHSVFKEVCSADVEPDGLQFDPASISIEDIREDQIYHGLRVNILGHLGTARLEIQVDVGLGDSIVPDPMAMEYPVLLDLPSPRLKVYPRESVVSEKLDAMIALGLRNTRVKDYYDIWTLCRSFPFNGPLLTAAIRSTLQRRGRDVPASLPAGLSDEFAADTAKQKQWAAFLKRSRLPESSLPLPDVVAKIRDFLGAPIEACARQTSFGGVWQPGGPWRRGA